MPTFISKINVSKTCGILCVASTILLVTSIFSSNNIYGRYLYWIAFSIFVLVVAMYAFTSFYKSHKVFSKGKNNNSAAASVESCIFSCPKCTQKLRVPKGRGRICITCSNCKMEFIEFS